MSGSGYREAAGHFCLRRDVGSTSKPALGLRCMGVSSGVSPGSACVSRLFDNAKTTGEETWSLSVSAGATAAETINACAGTRSIIMARCARVHQALHQSLRRNVHVLSGISSLPVA